MAVVLITSEYFGKLSTRGKELLVEAGHEVIENPYGHKFLSEEEIIPHIGKADAIVCDLEKITRKVMDAAPHLKIISRRGIGVDSVNLEEAQKREILVARTMGVVENAVSELVMAYILTHARKIRELDCDMKKHKWNKILGSSMEGKTLGIIGLGNIAAEVVKKAKAFDMKIVYFDIYRSEEKEEALGVTYMALENLLNQADYITLHMPLNSGTEKMFNYELFCKMKPTAFFINTARGAIVDENGLYRALKEGRITGAAIDVFDMEPKENSVLCEFKNVILTPHVATFTRETFIQMDILAVKNIIDFFNGVQNEINRAF